MRTIALGILVLASVFELAATAAAHPGCAAVRRAAAWPLRGAGWPGDFVGGDGRLGLQWTYANDAQPQWLSGPDDHVVQSAGQPLVIRNVTVISADAAPRAGVDVVIQDGKIARIGAGAAAPERARVVDGAGRFLIPGLWDMHAHLNHQGGLWQNLGHGVTGVRVMWGSVKAPVNHYQWRDEIAGGKMLGPRMVVASSIIDGVPASWPGSTGVADAAGAREAVATAKQDGADFIKVYSMLKKDAFDAIAVEAKAAGLPFAGHVPFRVKLSDALAAGQRSFEHMYGLQAACSKDEDALIRELGEKLDEAVQGGQTKQLWEIAGNYDAKFDEGFDEAKAQEAFGAMAKAGAWVVPTVAMLEREKDPAAKASARAARRLLPMLSRAGVKIVAGSDEPNSGLACGQGLLDELDALAGCGLSARDVLRAATLEAARCAGVDDRTGSIEVGKDADLVLLDADPLADIRAVRGIRAVIARGALLGRDELESLRAAGKAMQDEMDRQNGQGGGREGGAW